MSVPTHIQSLAKQHGFTTASFFGASKGASYYILLYSGGGDRPAPTGRPTYVVERKGEVPQLITDDALYELLGRRLYNAWSERWVD